MFKKPTRTQFIIRRVVLSTLATLSVIGLVTFAVLSMLGYRLDRDNGTLQQGALLQFDSRPSGADVYINDRLVGGKTANKQAVVAGTHLIDMKKAGYEDWSRSVAVKPGTLTWVNYTRFVPKERKPVSVASYDKLSQMLFSPDRRWAVAQDSAESPIFQHIDLRSEAIKSQALTMPASLYSEADTVDVAHSFNIVRWNTPSRHILVRHDFGDRSEWLVVDLHDTARSVNVSRLLSADFKDLQFAGTNGSTLYGLTTDGVIRKLDLGAGTMSRGFVTHVKTFQMFANNILVYSGANSDAADKNVVGVYRDGDESSSVLREVAADIPLSITTAQYHGNDYVAIAEAAKVTILKGAYPSAQAKSETASLKPYAVFKTPSSVEDISFSPSGEYVVAKAGDVVTSYDIEYKGVFTGAAAGAKVAWLDDAHLWGDKANNLTMVDFDSSNGHAIMPIAPGYDVTLSQNGRFIYAVGKTESGFTLQRVQMILQ